MGESFLSRFIKSCLHYSAEESALFVRRLKRGKLTDEECAELNDYIAELLYGAGRQMTWKTIPGHLWGESYATKRELHEFGPRPAKVLVIGKMPGQIESTMRQHLCGPSGEYLWQLLERLVGDRKEEIFDFRKWYVTNAIRFWPGPEKFRESWIRENLFLLEQELRIVRPDWILCLGREAARAVLRRGVTLQSVRRAVLHREIDLRRSDSEPRAEHTHTARVLCVSNPADVLRHLSEMSADFEADISKFVDMLGTAPTASVDEVDYRDIDTEEQLIALCADVRRYLRSRPPQEQFIAIDCEWHGDHPQNKSAYLRTVQIAWGPGRAACVVLRREGANKDTFAARRHWSASAALVGHLQPLFLEFRCVGHFFQADAEWLQHLGFDVWTICEPPKSYMDVGKSGFCDTALLAHALDETADFSLTGQVMRYLDMPRYDLHVAEYRKEYCKAHRISEKELPGYGEFPDAILLPYAKKDADATWRLAHRHFQFIAKSEDGLDCRRAFWHAQCAWLAVLEMRLNGILMDRDRLVQLRRLFAAEATHLEQQIRKYFRWPTLNLFAYEQMREALFGVSAGQKKRLRPPEALSLKLKPELTTGKYKRPWHEREETDQASTDRRVLGILCSRADKVLAWRHGKYVERDLRIPLYWIRDWRLLSQALKTVLRDPAVGFGGHESFLCDDGRIRTTIYQTKETGRWSSARPAMQNISKERDGDYQRILGSRFRYGIRSVFRASPGKVFVEADYIGAELAAMAILSGDERMLEDVRRNQLPGDHKDHIDIHSQIAVMAFRLPCPATKAGLASVGKSHLRHIAKSVVFGVCYGRSAAAIATQAHEEGIDITVEDAEDVIAALFNRYPKLRDFFEACRDRIHPRHSISEQHENLIARRAWICTPFGRYRRFNAPVLRGRGEDAAVIAELIRQAYNFPIQSVVADFLNLAVYNLYEERKRLRAQQSDLANFQFCLAVHDSLILEVDCSILDRFVSQVLVKQMSDNVCLFRSSLDGVQIDATPYHLAVDTSVYEYWAEPLTVERCRELGISQKWAKAKG